jgi:hypothetical protein
MTSYFYRAIAFAIVIGFTPFSIISPALADISRTITSKHGLNYMTGGVGHDEVLEMRTHAKKFTLNLLFSEGEAGQSVTDVNVNIYNEKSDLVFRIKAAKPLLYVNLPAGHYTILANYNGTKLRHKLSIEGNTNQKVILNWKDEEISSRETDNQAD